MQLELPVVLPEAEWANPLTRGLKTALVFDNGYAFDAAKGGPRAFTNAIGTPTITSAKATGRSALYTPNGSAANFALGEDWSGPSTLVWTSFVESIDNPWGGVLAKLATGTSTQYAAQRNVGNDYFQLSRNYSASVVNARTLSSFLGAPITFALVNESAAAASRFALYANGILVQAFNPVEAQNGGAGALLLGCENSSNATYDSSVFWDSVFRFDRALSDGEVAAIGTNPRQLLVQERRIWVPVSAGGGSTSLTVNETTHAHSADALTLTTSAVLTISDSTHAHAAESPAPSSSLGLTIAEALHGHAADSLTLSVTGSESLVTADATHGHAADSLALSSDTGLTIAEALHGHAADSLTLSVTGSESLVTADATHGHAADSLALSSDTGLTVADALHAHAADNLTLDTTGAATLTTQDATHAHAVDAPMLYTDWLLAVAEATHGHAADNVSLSDAPELAPQDATHGHTADVLALSADTWLTIQQATQAQAADNVTLGGVAPEPWPLLATRGVSAHGHGSARPEQRSTATRRNVQ